MWIALVIAVVLVGLTVAAALGRIDGSLAEPTSSLAYVPLPDGPLTGADLEAIRLDTGLRGYRMDQVDEVIGRLAEEIGALREQLQGRAGDPDAVAAAIGGSVPDAGPTRGSAPDAASAEAAQPTGATTAFPRPQE